MKRFDFTHTQPKNDESPVSEIQGKVKLGKIHAHPTIDNDFVRDNLEQYF